MNDDLKKLEARFLALEELVKKLHKPKTLTAKKMESLKRLHIKRSSNTGWYENVAAANKRKEQDPDFIRNRRAARQVSSASFQTRENHKRAAARTDPAKKAARYEALKRAWADPVKRAAMSAKCPEVEAKRIAKMSQPEVKAKMVAAQRRRRERERKEKGK